MVWKEERKNGYGKKGKMDMVRKEKKKLGFEKGNKRGV